MALEDENYHHHYFIRGEGVHNHFACAVLQVRKNYMEKLKSSDEKSCYSGADLPAFSS